MTIKALSAGVKRSVRTHNGRAYENTTPQAIAQDVARRNKMKLVGKSEAVPYTGGPHKCLRAI